MREIVKNIHSDEVLVVETDSCVKKYMIGDGIRFESKEGFVIEGILENITGEQITIKFENVSNTWDISDIHKILL